MHCSRNFFSVDEELMWNIMGFSVGMRNALKSNENPHRAAWYPYIKKREVKMGMWE